MHKFLLMIFVSQKPTTASVVCFTQWDSRSFTLMDFKSRVNGTLEFKVMQGNEVIHFLALIKFFTHPPSPEKKIIKNMKYVFCATQVF